MLALWMLPTLATVEFLDIWYVPPVSMVLLFLLPVDSRRGETTLVRKDLQEGVSWNVLFLVVGGMAMVSGLTRLGVTDWMIGAAFAGNVAAPALPWLAGLLTTVLTQVGSGISATVMVSSMLFPIADTAGRHSHSRPLAVGCRSPQLGAASRLLADRSWGGADARRRLLRVRHRPALRGRASLGRQGSAGSAGADRARFCCRLAALSFRLALSVGLVPLPSLGPPSALSPVWRVALLRGFALPCPGGPVPDDQVAHVGDDEVGRSPLSCHDVIRTRSPSDTVESRRRLWSSGVEACRSPRSPGAFGPPITRPPRL